MNKHKERICTYIDEIGEQLFNVSKDIYNHPELKFEEHRASKLLAEHLRQGGFSVQLGVAGLQTAIEAVHPAATAGPTVAILGEYDALPGIGHACGHNLIATPSSNTVIQRGSLAITEVEIKFAGKAAHASGSPEKGINALDAVIQTFNGVNALRQHIKDGARIHGIITDGGAKPNIVPEHAAASFYVRAKENDYRDELLEKLHNCAKGAALSAGATLSFETVGHTYKAMRPNHVLGDLFTHNLEVLGEPLNPPPPDAGMGSTDMADVTHAVPGIHAYIQICGEEVAGHSLEFAKASISKRGQQAMLTASKALAMTAVDLFTDPNAVRQMKEEFQSP